MLAHQLAQAQVTLGTGTVLPTAVVGAVVAGRDAPGRNRNCRRIVSHRKQNGITTPLWDTIRPLKKVGNEKKNIFPNFLLPRYPYRCASGFERIATAQAGPHYEQKKTNIT